MENAHDIPVSRLGDEGMHAVLTCQEPPQCKFGDLFGRIGRLEVDVRAEQPPPGQGVPRLQVAHDDLHVRSSEQKHGRKPQECEEPNHVGDEGDEYA